MDKPISTNSVKHRQSAHDKLELSADTMVNLASAVFNATQESIVVTERNGTIVAVNPAFSAITGFSAAEIVGKSMRTLQSGRQGRAFYREMWDQVSRSGYWQGEIWNRRKNGEAYPALLTISSVPSGLGQPTYYVGISADLSRIKRSELKLDRLAHHDELTGLPNRRLLKARLDQALARAVREGETGAVVFVDLDRFKLVNDSLGHSAGDELLTLVAKRLRNGLRAGDFLARFGGDEFIVLLEQTSGERAASVAAHLINRLGEPFVLSTGDEIFSGASVGISLFPRDGTSSEEVLQHADAALYQAKSAGRSTYRHYSSDLTRHANIRLALDSQLRRALSRNELVLNYQPLVTLADRRVFGVEALIRWNDPSRGVIPPAEFLPVAEETGLIVAIGNWVLDEACTQMQAWQSQGLALSRVAVNISARQFRHPEFAASVARALRRAGLAGEHLELEITEGTLMDHDATTLATLEALKALGVRLAVDDFGTGYSSLAYLKKLPVDTLKIDRSFVTDIGTDPASAAIATAIIGLGRCLGLEVLAEGIQSESQHAALLAGGCALGQGHLFARPVAPDAVPGLPGLRRRRAAQGGTRRVPACEACPAPE
ncbi:EAL domain-containing protein [Hyphomicrobium sp.]|uniref:putative bifunctional diguanylate cyclase/phosphodiesterase n=1 Tax=Hyphomicrobium sp. TaxID=82 RepID=UPI0025BBB0A6|nr:EAL domain-containing protein [Hyphomicrobium sp.]MCC7254021.1 EAL domain-containing protein [Hyphomicrobium sp.]